MGFLGGLNSENYSRRTPKKTSTSHKKNKINHVVGEMSGGSLMPSKKSAEYYEAEIRKLYPEIKLLKAYCEANREDKSTLGELEQKKSNIRYFRDKWAERKQVIVYVDGREQLENTPEELGYPTQRTPQYDAKKWPWYSVGDYTAYIDGIGWYPVCRERKSLADLDNTLRDKDHRKNFFEEYERFKVDPRFKNGIFRFDLECTPEELEDFLPPMPKTCKYCSVKRQKMDSGDYFCPKNFKILEYDPSSDFKCHEGFEERKRDAVNVSAMKTLRKTIIRQCLEIGMQVVWRGSRDEACKAYREGIVEYLKLNYVKFLKLDVEPYNDLRELDRKIAQCEAELEALKGSRKSLEAVC